jgi:N-carbamoyl-L-amino-acid hydrolase
MPVHIDLERLRRTLDAVNSVAATEEGGVSRVALTDEDRAGRDLLVRWMQETGLDVRVDDLGTIYGRRKGAEPDLPVVFGSHLDSVPNGGRFDGALGVVAGLEVMRRVSEQDIQTRRPLELVSFTNEEGVRFEPAMMASGVLAGQFTRDYVYSRTDRAGTIFGDELARIGYRGDVEHRLPGAVAFLELHVEQGPVLDTRDYPVAIVEGIQGITWLEVTFTGQADHAGPTPMALRRDAFVAASRLVAFVQEMAKRIGGPAVATTGRCALEPDIINAIPGRAVISVDVRHPDQAGLDEMEAEVHRLAAEAADAEQVEVAVERIWSSPPTSFDSQLIAVLERMATRLGVPYHRMVSGAGHDAKYMAEIAPTVMIFVRSLGGYSHCPEEDSDWQDIEQAVTLLLNSVLQLAT